MNTMTKNQAICLVFLTPYTKENAMVARLTLEASRLEVCYRDDPQLPFLLPINTYNRAILYNQVHAFPDENRL